MQTAAGNGLGSDDEEPMYEPMQSKRMVKSYEDEQKELKNAFLQAFEEDVEDATEKDGELLRHKQGPLQHPQNADDDENEHHIQRLLDAYFYDNKKDGEMNEDDQFLKDYILQRKWIGDETGNYSDPENVEEDEAAMEAAEAYEAEYNFRFEEPGGSSLVTHPRQLEGIVRKEDDKRKRKRAEKAQRKAEEEEGRRAELKRLKNLKKGEIMNKLTELQTVAGAAAPKAEVLDKLLGGDFDPEAHDRAMAAAFGDDYYGMDEDEEDIEDEIFEKEFAAIAEYDSDGEQDEAQQTFAALEKKLKDVKAADHAAPGQGDQLPREDLKKLVEEYHRLDYEDFVGGIPTRFRYKEVEPETYGLTVEDILAMEDKDLNQIIGFKNVAATYRTDGRKMRPNYGKLNELRKHRSGDEDMIPRKTKLRQGSMRFKNKEDKGEGKRDFQAASVRSDPPTQDGKLPGKIAKLGENSDKKETSGRLASFVPPSLKKKGNSNVTKKNKGATPPRNSQKQLVDHATGLTKAQKKNMKRAAKRAAKKAGGASER